MDNLERGVELIRRKMRIHWDEQHTELTALCVDNRRRRRKRVLSASSVVVPFLMVAAAAIFNSRLAHPPSSMSPTPSALQAEAPKPSVAPPADHDTAVLRFSDGSLAKADDAKSAVAIVEDTPSNMLAEVSTGRGRFDVVTDATRMFAVRAGQVLVIAIGTNFTVERQTERVDVRVEHGRVRVEYPGGMRELGAGEAGSFETRLEPPVARDNPKVAEERLAPKVTWQSFAEQRRFGEAYGMMHQTKPAQSAKDLMLAADVARFAGHPEEAAGYLGRVVTEHPREFYAQLAAFSLGRIYLEQLGRPLDAASRFAEARALAGTGALSQDALAREVEALSRGGKASDARAKAQEYVRLFPNGQRLGMVRKLGDLDAE